MKKILPLLLLCVLPYLTIAQWGTSPETVLNLSDADEASFVMAIDKDANGNYISCWYDNNYKLFYQILNQKGEKKFEEAVLVSSQVQPGFVGDIKLLVDGEDDVYITHTDSRVDDSPNIVVYKMNQDGEFLWSEDGLQITSDDKYNEGPELIEDSQGLLIAYNILSDITYEHSYIALNQITTSGDIVHETPIYIKEEGRDLFYPSLHLNADGSFFVVYASTELSGGLGHIHVMKFAEDLKPITTEPVLVTLFPGAKTTEQQEVALDPQGNLWVAWFDDNGGSFKFNARVQKLNLQAEVQFLPGGKKIADVTDSLSIVPSFVDFTEDGILFDYFLTDKNQDYKAIYMQKLDMNGERLWGDAGKELVPSNKYLQGNITTVGGPDKSLALYTEYIDDTFFKKKLKVIGADYEGELLWDKQAIVLNEESDMIGSEALVAVENKQWVIGWSDTHTSKEIAYAQNLNLDGTRGEPSSIGELNINIDYRKYPDHIIFDKPISAYTIYDCLGRMVEHNDNGTFKIDMKHHKDDLYILRIQNKESAGSIKFYKH